MILMKKMSSETIEDVRLKLQTAIELEHSTIPPYLTANFTLINQRSDTNAKISGIIGSVLGEEMLHMTIAANLLNAVGGTPAINTPTFIPKYPGHLPGAVEGSLVVGLEKFSIELVQNTFMEIEEPENPAPVKDPVPQTPDGETIGEFYQGIITDMQNLVAQGQNIFTGDPARQVTMENFYPSSVLFPVTNLEEAINAINIIIDQGEGTSTDPFVAPQDQSYRTQEPSHYFRFEEIVKGQELILNTDGSYSFSGDQIPFDPSTVANMAPNPKMADYVPGTTAYENMRLFNYNYTCLLNTLHETFNGNPDMLTTALGNMFSLRLYALKLLAQPSNVPNMVAGPSFEYVPEL
jgi:Ferritin-like